MNPLATNVTRAFSFLQHVRTTLPPLLLLGACLGALGLAPHTASGQAVYTVNATGDAADANTGNGTCATASGDCTLRAALQEANATTESDEIEFDISGGAPHTIQPQSALPTVSEPVIIDGSSEPDYIDGPVVELDGQDAGSSTAGLTITRASTVQGLAIINFDGNGLVLDLTVGSTIQENYIGVAADGAAAGNGGNGILVQNQASSNLIGPDNVISDNSRRGIFVGLSGADDNTVFGNLIGTSPDGMSDMGNGYEGVLLNNVTGTTIGGTSPSNRNVLSGNGRDGIQITGSGATSNTVAGNYIGTNGEGDALLGNDGNGVALTSGATATIGGTASGEANVIAGNEHEIYIDTDNNTVQGNFLGTNPAGDDLGSSFNALRVASGSGNLIGGAASGAGNVIGYTATNSVRISGTNNIVQGNFIGTNPAGDNLSAAGTAIRLSGSGHTVGGTGSGEGNTLTNNGFGIGVGSGTGHTIRGNAIFDNIELGLDFNRDGVTANDAGDPDDGVNRLQNFPEFQSASYDAGTNEVTVTYLVPSDPNAGGDGASAYDLTVDFYQADADGEEGAAYLGSDTYTASEYSNCGSAPCTVTATFTPNASVSQQESLLATATDANGNTSEFAASAAGLGPNVVTVDATGDASDANAGDGTCATSGGDCTLRAAIEETNALSNNTAGPDEIHFDISGTGPHTIQPQSALPDVSDPVVIDGRTEPDFSGDPVVALDGSNQSINTNMLNLDTGSGGSSVLALSLTNINGQALFIRTDNNLVDGCWFGLTPDGTGARISAQGIRIFGSSNQIGHPNGSGNVVVNSGGIDLSNGSTPGNTIQNNLIGVTPSGTPAGNFFGVSLGTGIGGSGNTIGGPGSNEGNVIQHNDNEGIVATDGVGITIRGNQISDNGRLGIDLGGIDDGPTPNDAGDGDDGINRLQNFPEIQNASYDAGADEVTVTYAVPSDPNAGGSGGSAYDLTIDFYRTGPDQAEGAAYLGTDTYTSGDYNTSTSGPEPKTITFTPTASVTKSDHIVATATDANGNTSEFSTQSRPLPVELTALEATQTGEGVVELAWQVASEQNNAGFAVQHQLPGRDAWSELDFVESTAPGGTTTEAQSYQYATEDLAVGTHRFPLKQVDLDGATTFTDPVTIELRMDEALQLAAPAPNPVQSQATLSFAVKREASTVVTLYNVLGQQVRTLYDGRPTAGEAQRLHLDASALSSGVYIVQLKAQGQTRTRRLTVVH